MPYSLSPSSLNLFKECPRCFWLQFNGKIRRPNGIFPSLPGGMDRILKVHFDSFRAKGEMPPELAELSDTKLFDDETLLNEWRNNKRGIKCSDENGNVLRGAIDDLLVHNQKFVVLDFKTRGSPLKENTAEFNQDQLNLYHYIFQQNGYKTENHAYLLFYHPNKVLPTGEILFHNDLKRMEISIKDAGKLLGSAINLLETDCPTTNCDWCQWNAPSIMK